MAKRFHLLALPLLALATPALPQDAEEARFAPCGSAARVTCVVDGDTFWYHGAKIRLTDINTPETSQPGCAAEADLGARATRRLIVLLNEGRFSLEAGGRDRDRYGRLLRVVTRDGESLGAVLVAEGLAEPWQGHRSDWCAQLALAQ
jgi:micrococcal nuclease